MSKVLTTTALIKTSLRRAMLPSDQATFTCCDVIDIMNEELGIHILPMVLRAHEEYYVHDEDLPLSKCTTRYKIPYRASGNKLRDVQYVDTAGAYYEMTRISLEDRAAYTCCQYSYNQLIPFYIHNDSVVLIQNQSTNGSLRMSYFLRPNNLVKDNRAGKITAIGNDASCITITSFTNLISGTADSIKIGSTSFAATSCCVVLGCATFKASADNCTTAASLVSQINAHTTAGALVTASACGAIVTVLADCSSTTLTTSYSDGDCNIGATVTATNKTFTVSSFPTHFTACLQYDFIQGKSSNKIMTFDICAVSVDSTAKTIKFLADDLKELDLFGSNDRDIIFSVGDYIMQQEETIVAQLPTELQPILAQRTAVKMLEALGDIEGMKAAQNELERMEYNAQSLIDNRVEGAPQKISSRHSLLKSSLSRRSRNGGA